MNLSSFSKINN